MAGASDPRATGHSQVAHPGADGTCNPLQMGDSVRPWTCHQVRAHKLSAYAEQPPVGSYYVDEGIPRVNACSAPRSLEAVQEEEEFRHRGHKHSSQARFVTDEHDQSPDTKQLVNDMLAYLGRDSKSRQSLCAEMATYRWANAS